MGVTGSCVGGVNMGVDEKVPRGGGVGVVGGWGKDWLIGGRVLGGNEN